MTLSEMRTIFQGISVLLIIATMVIQIKQTRFSKTNLGYNLAIIFWLLHALVFYVFVFLNQANIYNVYTMIPSNTWSSGLRFHGFVTIFCIEISRLQTMKFAAQKLGG